MTKKEIFYGILGAISVIILSFSGYIFFATPQTIVDGLDVSSSQLPKIIRPQFSVLFVGDMMFDRGVRSAINKNGFEYVFGDSPQIFKGSNLVVGNLEGPITNSSSATLFSDGSMSDQLIFTFPTSTALALKQNGIGMVTLANNHEENFGSAGIIETKKYLSDAGVSYFGDPQNKADIATTTCKDSMCISFIGYNEFSNLNKQNIIDKIHELRPLVDFVVVFAHWGDEYNAGVAARQQSIAHQWIDEGADLIIGSHPHVVEPIETYKGKTIFYSLGNYIFDQYFSFNTTHAIGAKITFRKGGYSYDMIPIQNIGNKVSIPDATTSGQILDAIRKLP